MSAFLGPIHHWLFNKIVHMEGRAFAIASMLSDNGQKEAVDQKIADYGQKLEGADLAQLVGDNSIHQFLYGLISKVEVFEAGIVETASDFDKVLQTVEAHGKASAEQALSQSGEAVDDAEALYKYVNDYVLEGMPCDPGAEVQPIDNKRFAYNHTACNHIPNWEYTACSPSKMCAVHNAWLKGFVSGLNSNATLEVKETIADGAGRCSAEISIG